MAKRTDDNLNDLLNVSFLQDWPTSIRLRLSLDSSLKKVKRGGILFREGSEVRAVYVIQKGKIKLVRYDNEGREIVVGIFTEGEFIWESVLLDKKIFPYSGICISDVEAAVVDLAAFTEVISDPNISMRIITLLSRKLHDANDRNIMLAAKDPLRRVAAFLIYRWRKDNSRTLEFNLNDIAASTNMRPETASRKIGELADLGCIQRSGKSRITITDLQKLEEMTT